MFVLNLKFSWFYKKQMLLFCSNGSKLRNGIHSVQVPNVVGVLEYSDREMQAGYGLQGISLSSPIVILM